MNRLVFFILPLFAISCAEKLIDAPKDLIPKDKMVAILNDMAILNAARTTAYNKMGENGLKTMDFIFAKYGIDSMQFVQSDRYYASKPLEYESIYSRVEVLLEQENKRWKNIKKLNDSLKLREKDSIRESNRKNRLLKNDSLKKDRP